MGNIYGVISVNLIATRKKNSMIEYFLKFYFLYFQSWMLALEETQVWRGLVVWLVVRMGDGFLDFMAPLALLVTYYRNL